MKEPLEKPEDFKRLIARLRTHCQPTRHEKHTSRPPTENGNATSTEARHMEQNTIEARISDGGTVKISAKPNDTLPP